MGAGEVTSVAGLGGRRVGGFGGNFFGRGGCSMSRGHSSLLHLVMSCGPNLGLDFRA